MSKENKYDFPPTFVTNVTPTVTKTEPISVARTILTPSNRKFLNANMTFNHVK